jgi:hypothetical protein
LETCDLNGIAQSGYRAIYKKFTGAVNLVGKGLKIGCLPNPHKVTLIRQQLNMKVSEYVGAYYSICDTFEGATRKQGAKNKEQVRVSLNESNNFFVDVEQVQRTMICMYNFTSAGMNLLLHHVLIIFSIFFPFNFFLHAFNRVNKKEGHETCLFNLLSSALLSSLELCLG